MDREIESAKIADGECFGKGAYGEKVAEKYAWVKGIIAEQRMVVEEGIEKVLAKKRTLEKEQINFERWRAENPEDVVRHVGNMKLEIVLIAKRDLFGQPSSNTVITIEATNTTTSKILKPRNQRIYGYEFGSNVGGRYSIGAYLTDSFGNEYKLTSIEPQFMGNEGKGIRPGEIVTFTLRFGDVPLQNAMSVSLAIDPDTLGQQAGAVFELPIEAFYGPL
jgi:hypothetical protein